jgi:hypothetical protein
VTDGANLHPQLKGAERQQLDLTPECHWLAFQACACTMHSGAEASVVTGHKHTQLKGADGQQQEVALEGHWLAFELPSLPAAQLVWQCLCASQAESSNPPSYRGAATALLQGYSRVSLVVPQRHQHWHHWHHPHPHSPPSLLALLTWPLAAVKCLGTSIATRDATC